MKWLRLLHRYVGLTLALFIVLVSVTGSLLAFYPELDRAIAPDWFPAAGETGAALPLPVLARIAQDSDPQAAVTGVRLDEMGRASVAVTGALNPQTGAAFTLTYNEIVLNAHTGELLGKRIFGEFGGGRYNVMPFIFEFHDTLVAGDPGKLLIGIVALIWFVDCFTGLVITFPRFHSTSKKSWLQRWKKAWQIKTTASFPRINFDVHRAFSLWLWLVLAVFAWTSVYMNLTNSVYAQVTRLLMPLHLPGLELDSRADTAAIPPRSFNEMYEHADREMRKRAIEDGFEYRRPVRLSYNPKYGAYRFGAQSDLDISDRIARTDIYLDANTHELLLAYYPSSQYAGNTLSNWLYALHSARVWGLPYRIFICVLGIVLVIITVSGVLIWWRKRAH